MELKEIETKVLELEKDVKGKFDKLYEVLNEAVTTGRNAYGIYSRMEMFIDDIAQLKKTLSEQSLMLRAMMTDEKYSEDFQLDQLHGWYMKSGLTLKEIRAAYNAHFPDKEIKTDAQIHNYITGKTVNREVVSFLGKYLRNAEYVKTNKTAPEVV